MMSASKNKDTIAERRLRPIYDAIDAGNNKKAIQEADKLIKKHPASHAAKALKALAYIRLLKYDEAWTLINEVEQNQITDDSTLQALTHCFKELARPDRICRMYEAACKLVPTSEELLSHLFMSYVRTLDYRKQFVTATQLFKEYPRPTYGLWGVMSALMQAISNPEFAKISLPLARKMATKAREAAPVGEQITAAEVQLRLMVLELSEEWQEAIDVLEGPMITQSRLDKSMWDRNYRILELYQKLNKHELVVERCVTQLMNSRDDWRLWSLMFTSAFQLLSDNPNGKSDLIRQITDCILTCVTPVPGQPVVRGPHLARLRWISGLLEHDFVIRADLGSYKIGEPMDLLLEYVERFSDRACCCSDIRPYLCLLGEQQQAEFLTQLGASQSTKQPLKSEHIGAINAWMCNQQLTSCLNGLSSKTSAEKVELAAEAMKHYLHNLHFEKTANSSDFLPADSFLFLASQMLWDVYSESGDISVLHEMAVMLECALKKSPCNHQFAVILVKIYVILGAPERALELCTDPLGIKNVQLDSLGYLVFDAFRPFGSFETAITETSKVSAYFTHTGRDVVDGLVTSYYRGAFVQIPDLLSYHDTCLLSMHRVGAQILRPFLNIITLCPTHASSVPLIRAVTSSQFNVQVDFKGELISVQPIPSGRIEWNKLKDNRDFGILPDWEPGADERLAQRSKASFQEMIDIIRYHYLIIKILAVIAGTVNQSLDARRSDLRALRIQLKAHHKHCQQQYAHPNALRMQDSACVQWSLYIAGGYFDMIDCMIDCAYFLMCQGSSESSGASTCKSDAWSSRDVAPDSGHVSSATPSSTSFSSDGGASDGDTASVLSLSELSLGHRSMQSSSVSNSDRSRSTSMREQSPDRLNALPTADDLQAIVRRILSNHQIQCGQSNGHVLRSPNNSASSPSNTNQLAAGQFPHLQMCHISYLIQSVGVVLFISSLIRQCTASSNQSTPALVLPPDALKKKEKESTPSDSGSSVKSSKSKRGKKAHGSSTTATTSTGSESAAGNKSPVNLYCCPTLLDQMAELSAVLCQVPFTLERLLSDVTIMLEDAPLKMNKTCLLPLVLPFDEANVMKDVIGGIDDEVSGWLRSSYTKSLDQMRSAIGTQKELADSLTKS